MHPLHTLAVKRCDLSSFLLLWKNVKFKIVVLTVSKEKFYHQDGEFSQLHFILPWPSIIERQPKDWKESNESAEKKHQLTKKICISWREKMHRLNKTKMHELNWKIIIWPKEKICISWTEKLDPNMLFEIFFQILIDSAPIIQKYPEQVQRKRELTQKLNIWLSKTSRFNQLSETAALTCLKSSASSGTTSRRTSKVPLEA